MCNTKPQDTNAIWPMCGCAVELRCRLWFRSATLSSSRRHLMFSLPSFSSLPSSTSRAATLTTSQELVRPAYDRSCLAPPPRSAAAGSLPAADVGSSCTHCQSRCRHRHWELVHAPPRIVDAWGALKLFDLKFFLI